MANAVITIDDEPVVINLPASSYDLMIAAGVDPEKHYVQRVIRGKAGYAYRVKHEIMAIHNNDQFVTVYTGATTNG